MKYYRLLYASLILCFAAVVCFGKRLPVRLFTTAAVELRVSYNTIKSHMRHIYEKLQVHSKSEAVAVAMRDLISGNGQKGF
ncbi:MAG: LuxR C-terminal-related transcriptional regulator [Pyrinomonadaceae bacterium]|nr:LuxR C-terminal-related transcriptional regulator [Pyrinomonadaceae bacterium]